MLIWWCSRAVQCSPAQTFGCRSDCVQRTCHSINKMRKYFILPPFTRFSNVSAGIHLSETWDEYNIEIIIPLVLLHPCIACFFHNKILSHNGLVCSSSLHTAWLQNTSCHVGTCCVLFHRHLKKSRSILEYESRHDECIWCGSCWGDFEASCNDSYHDGSMAKQETIMYHTMVPMCLILARSAFKIHTWHHFLYATWNKSRSRNLLSTAYFQSRTSIGTPESHLVKAQSSCVKWGRPNRPT